MQGHEDFLLPQRLQNTMKQKEEVISRQLLVISKTRRVDIWTSLSLNAFVAKNKKPRLFSRGCIKNQLLFILLMQHSGIPTERRYISH
jgi:hypothetical protein